MRQHSVLPVDQLENRLVFSGFITIPNTSDYPFRAVAHVSTWWDMNHNSRRDDGEEFQATAEMIGPDSALTSAHVVYNASRGGFAKSVSIEPGRQGSTQPFGSFRAKNWEIPSYYKSHPSTSVDLAVLNFSPINFLTGSKSVGEITGWFGYKSIFSDSALKGSTIYNIGYPAESKSGVNEYRSTGKIYAAHSPSPVGWLEYRTSDIPVEHGSSGSPIYQLTSSGDRVVVGVHSRRNSNGTIGYAARITSPISSFIRQAEKVTTGGGGTVKFAVGVSVKPVGFGLDSTATDAAVQNFRSRKNSSTSAVVVKDSFGAGAKRFSSSLVMSSRSAADSPASNPFLAPTLRFNVSLTSGLDHQEGVTEEPLSPSSRGLVRNRPVPSRQALQNFRAPQRLVLSAPAQDRNRSVFADSSMSSGPYSLRIGPRYAGVKPIFKSV
jgi:V8-like Glu-specific endopeptidase